MRALVAAVVVFSLGCSGLYSQFDGGDDGGGGSGGSGGSGGGAGGGSGGGAGGGSGGSGGSGGGSGGAGGSGGGGGSGGAGGGGAQAFGFVPMGPAGAGLSFMAMHGLGATQVWVGSSYGTIHFWDGGQWTQVATLTGEIRGLYASPDGALYAATPFAIYRCASGCSAVNATFNAVASPMQTDVRGLCGRGDVEVYAAAYHQSGNSVIYGWNGTIFAQLAYTSNAHEIRGCAVLPDGRAVFVGRQDVLTWRPDAGSGTEYAPMSALGTEALSQQWHAVVALPLDGGAVAVGRSRRAAVRSASGVWSLAFDPTPADGGVAFRAVITTRPGELWAGGDPVGAQSLSVDTGGGFQFVTRPADLTVHAMWAANQDTFFIAGELPDGGAVFKAAR